MQKPADIDAVRGPTGESPVMRRYLEAVRAQNGVIDARGVMQVVRDVKLAIDDAFVGMRLRIERAAAETAATVSLMSLIDPTRSAAAASTVDLPKGRPAASARDPEEVHADTLLRRGSRWFVLGDPGGGKTTLLRQMAFRAAGEALRLGSVQTKLPLFLPLRHLGAARGQQAVNSVVDYLCGPGLDDLISVDARERQVWRSELQMALEAGRAILLCDGLDEQRDGTVRHATGRALENLLLRAPRAPCLITSRTVGFDAGPLRGSFAVARLQPFNERQTEQFFSNWMLALERADDPSGEGATSSRAQRRARQLMEQMRDKPGVMALASNPLMCSIIGLIYRQGAVLPEMRGELYKLCVDTFVFNWEVNKRRTGDSGVHLRADETQAVLEAIALHFQGRPSLGNEAEREVLLTLVTETASNEFGLSTDEARERADRLLDLVVVVAGLVVERAPGRFGFFHLTLQEYLAGRAMTRRSSDIARYLAAHWLDLRWRETILLAAAHQGNKGREDGEKFVQEVLALEHPHGEALQYSLRLALACSGELRVGPVVADQLLQRWWDAWKKQPALRQRLLPDALAAARGRLQPSGGYLRKCLQEWFGAGDKMSTPDACAAVAALGDTRALDILLATLREDDVLGRRAAVSALRELGDRRALAPLHDALRDEDAQVRQGAVRALGKIGDASDLNAVLAALNDDDALVRGAAAWALDDLGESRAFDALLKVLGDDDPGVRVAAVFALNRLDESRALDALTAELRGNQSGIRRVAPLALSLSRDPRAPIETRSGLLHDDAEVRAYSAMILGALNDASSFDALLGALRDQDEGVRGAAAWALGELGDVRAVDALQAALDDSEVQVRREVATALGAFADRRAIDKLKDALADGDAGVRAAASASLGRQGDRGAAAVLVTAAQDTNDEVRQAAITALGECGDMQVAGALRQAISDQSASVRRAAARSLGELGDLQSVELLIAALRDTDDETHAIAAQALGNLGGTRALDALVTLLRDSDTPAVREAARGGLVKAAWAGSLSAAQAGAVLSLLGHPKAGGDAADVVAASDRSAFVNRGAA